MADSIFRRLVNAVHDAYPAAAKRIYAPSIDDWRIGRREAQELKAPPYVAWIRGSTTFRTPAKAGPKQDAAEKQSVDPLADATQIVSAIIVGHGEQQTELVWYAVLGAVRDVFGMSPQLFGSATWTTQEEGNSGYVRGDVEAVIQEFNWSIMIPRSIDPLTVIQATEHDCEGIVP
jgi:hypothetical protein